MKMNALVLALALASLFIFFPCAFSLCAGLKTEKPNTLDTQIAKVQDSIASGNRHVQTHGGYPACTSPDDLYLAIDLIKNNDYEAFNKLVKNERCTILKAGSDAFIMDYGYYGTLVKVRPRGHTEGYWASVAALDLQ